MSFITKRERVFNEYDLFDLPARNEGKLKAYASCTDTRAWSHFCSDKSEHLVEVIKRNNETVQPKYVPTDVIVDTLMVAKNAEIARLKRKIEEFEQLLAAYDQLDLTCDQRCDIAQAHAAIRAANKELDDLCFDLDLSGFTEGIDSEGFATGKSTVDGDEAKTDSKGVQSNMMKCTCDAFTLSKDKRIDEMQECIITKDAKLNAMKNTIAVMENDVCEPYCIYAHIYTALEKIFATLCQNDKYSQYLKLLTTGKDIFCLDIKGKILFKLLVLEKFCVALIAPCTQEFITESDDKSEDCACYRVDVLSRVNPTFAVTSSELKHPTLDNKRAQLVADIIQNDEMKEILSKENSTIKADEEPIDDVLIIDNYNIDTENLKRLKSLQGNFNELMLCYEKLKLDKAILEKRCEKYQEMEREFENLKMQMREYNSLWNEKEHYRKRSVDLDSLKEQYLILSDETSNLETQLKAESEINHIKCRAMDSLRNENISLEKKLNEASIAFEKEKNVLLCKLKEAECRIMCQEQQIKTLSLQIDNIIEQDHAKPLPRDSENHTLSLMDDLQSCKEQIKNLRDALFCNEEEKQELQKHYQEQLELINELKLEIVDWKTTYEKTMQRNEYLEQYKESLLEETRLLKENLNENTSAVENLMNVIKNKSQEINKLMQDMERKKDENRDLVGQLNDMKERFSSSLVSMEKEKLQALQSLQIARQESQELLDKVKDYDQMIHKKEDTTKSLEQQLQDNKELQDSLMEENKNLKKELSNRDNKNSLLLQEIKRLRDVNEYAVNSINSLENENKQYQISLDVTRKESGELKDKMMYYDNLNVQLQSLQEAHEKLLTEKSRLENDLLEKTFELENAIHTIKLSKRESDELIDRLQQSQGSKDNELSRLSDAYQKLSAEKYAAHKELIDKKRYIENLLQTLNTVTLENEHLLHKCKQADDLEQELESLKKAYAELSYEKSMLHNDFENKTEEFNHLYNTLENKIEENRELIEQIKALEANQAINSSDVKSARDRLNVMKTQSDELVNKLKYYETLETEFEKMKKAHDDVKMEKENLELKIKMQFGDLKKMEQENEDLQNALIGTRTELIKQSTGSIEPYRDIIEEIEMIREEKQNNQKKIRDLLDKLEEAENAISSLNEDVYTRDSKIATLQNHLNELEEEVTRLHSSLAEVIDTGEQIKDFSFQKLDSLKNMEAHHSRATHNMKMELAKLQQENSLLSEQLSVTKVQSDEFSRDTFKIVSQVKRLQNEREIIVTDIKELELKTVGESDLAPNKCNAEDILASLDRIRKSFDARSCKSSSLERTLLKVQTSSQLLLSKADEAKKIVEREKQKIINEKEEAIIDKQHMEKQLLELKTKLENQIVKDKMIIDDLEATILNQKLIIDRINKSSQDYISKLKDELDTLQNLYKNSVDKISELQERLQSMTEDKDKLLEMIEEIKADLGKKSNEVAELQKQLDALKNKPHRNKEAQTKTTPIFRNMETQTDEELLLPVEVNTIDSTEPSSATRDKLDYMESINLMETNKAPLDKKHTQLEMQPERPHLINEVQVLAAAVEQPTFEVIKNSYIDYKMKRLKPGKLEQQSITCFTENDKEKTESKTNTSPKINDRAAKRAHKSTKKYVNAKTQSNNLIDIYNKQSMHTDSSKGNYGSDNIANSMIPSHSQAKSTGYAAHENYGTENNEASKYKDSKTYVASTSDNSTDKDLFVIYKDSENSYNNNNKVQSKGTWSGKGHSEIVVEAVTVHPTNNTINIDPKNYGEKDSYIFHENIEDDSVRQKLKISLPRVETESTTSDMDKKSLGSYTIALYSSPKLLSDSDTKINEDGKTVKHEISFPTISNDDNQFTGSYLNNYLRVESDEDAVRLGNRKTKVLETDSGTSKPTDFHVSKKKPTNSTPFGSDSYHKLSRVDADVRLLKAEPDQKSSQAGRKNFGLEYIMDTVQGEVDPDAIKYYATKDLRKTRSDERFNLVKIREKTDSSPSRLSEFKMSFTEYKTNSINSKSSDKSPKSFTERSIMAKLDTNNDYELKINSLTKALENIEKDYKKKIEAIKMQYDSNIKSIINEHNQGVKSIQSLHEETLQDIMKLHENEVENLRTMSIEAMRKAEKLERENRALKTKALDCGISGVDVEPIRMSSPEMRKHRKCRETRMLTKTNVEAFNVKPKSRSNGPCTCSVDVNISDTIRNIFEQVDIEQRKMAEHTYLKYIANKILNGNLDGPLKLEGLQALDAQELSFLHLKVCRTWKTKLSKEEALQKRIDSLESELMSKQRNAQQHIAELDRKVAEERRRLQEVREAVCRSTPTGSRACSPEVTLRYVPPPNPDKEGCACIQRVTIEAGGRRSAGDLAPELSNIGLRPRRIRPENNKATPTRVDVDERRERRLYHDEPPTRLRRSHDRQGQRSSKK
ncbi:sporulation-specific protein 15-like [Spodoptera litura]|uniref:Sporulation-specific protein 15-like n=1 Tax=Spodoptera litura TaxID=69820 RepID=A0A9J7E3U5_SPOLT|nr:sporulation-specific protein 15-like [Spodoptera litura]